MVRALKKRPGKRWSTVVHKSGSQQGPHFLGIGARKAATSWLAGMLRSHSGVRMPHPKGLHYFDRDPSYPSPTPLSTRNWFRRALVLDRRRFVRDFPGAEAGAGT